MSIQIVVPEMGESVLEATVSRWLKKQGDFVQVGEVVVELETDKVNLEVGAKGSGVLAKIDAPEGQDVKVGDVLGSIDEQAQPAEEKAPATEEAETQPPPAREEPPADAQPELGRDDGNKAERQPAQRATPVAARMARAQEVDLSQVAGSGPAGTVTKADVEQYLQTPDKTAPAAQPAKPQAAPIPDQEPASGREERQRMSRRRRTIAERLLEAQQTTAMLTTFNEVDMSTVMDLRRRRQVAFLKRYEIKLGLMSFFVKASISALKAFPRLNAEIQGDEVVLKHYYDIGVAIGAEEGLVVPVIRSAERLNFAEIERQIQAYVEKSNQGQLAIEDLRGGTFTITNGGVFGSLLSTPILNPPQTGILGLHAIKDRPAAVDQAVVIRPLMYVALTYDHRIVDGREAVQFLMHIKELVEDPERLLLEG